ncbi:MAG: alkaline phosphatase family protein [Candidatus Rokubacteria bacterium]|nr:alkaline phosphatase family protein [Candidatus Rokubacteria bacterium]
MKTLVVGLDGAAPELLLGDDRLENLRHLMEGGCYGRLESVVPPRTVPAWLCMVTSQDPGSLGVYGLHNRTDHSYRGTVRVTSGSVRETTIWNQVERAGKRVILIGVPPSHPPRPVNGICVGCSLTPDGAGVYAHPAAVQDEIARLVGDYPVDVRGYRPGEEERLKDAVYTMSRKQFQVVRHLVQNAEWDYFHFVEIGLDRLQHAFWTFHDPVELLQDADHPYREVVRDYYLYLDGELGSLLQLLDEETVILVLSDHGPPRPGRAVPISRWLIREGLLVLSDSPRGVTSLGGPSVNWEKTKVWSEGGGDALLFFNVKGREPSGTIDRSDYAAFREELKARLEASLDDQGHPLGLRVFKPEELYRTVRGVAPDLIVGFPGSPPWPSDAAPGWEPETALQECGHGQAGAFILAGPDNPLLGEIEGAHLLDMAPTLLELGGYDIPRSMQGRSLVAGTARRSGGDTGLAPDEEAIIRERLRGLGYIA